MLSDQIKQKALDLGFDLVGIAPADVAPHAGAYQRWLDNGYEADMQWMGRDPQRRSDPRAVLPGARSLVIVGQSYFVQNPPPEIWNDPTRGRIARYAWGADYHDLMLPRIQELGAFIDQQLNRQTAQRAYVDTGAILEKDHASRAGLGFVGKNSLIINPHFGSYVFLGELLVDVALEYDAPVTEGSMEYFKGGANRHPGLRDGMTSGSRMHESHEIPDQVRDDGDRKLTADGLQLKANKTRTARCGSCTKCMDACPTQAIVEPHVVDANKCIAYHTIENRGEIPPEIGARMGNWIFGCDICQEVCPWVRNYSQPSQQPFLKFDPDRHCPKLEDVLRWDQADFRERYKGTPVWRTKLKGLQRNARIAWENANH